MNELGSNGFNAKRMCGALCLQHKTNELFDKIKKGELLIEKPEFEDCPVHVNFV
ncbi:MAG: hypothetical protein HN474_07005 [Nitrospina sp.]|nr:hypothetical protein [Nitrospina sp.]